MPYNSQEVVEAVLQLIVVVELVQQDMEHLGQ
jgi:hypothetical protein